MNSITYIYLYLGNILINFGGYGVEIQTSGTENIKAFKKHLAF
jgi:hypothetical protein